MKRFALLLAILVIWMATATPADAQTGLAPGAWVSADPPAGIDAPSAQWIKIGGPNGRTFLVAVFRPQGAGPFPVVVVLHGAAGFRQAYVPIGSGLAQAGLLAVVGCWQAIGALCADAPPEATWAADPAANAPKELIAAARTLPGARADRVGLYGTSRGAYAAPWAASTGIGVQVVVADAPGNRPVSAGAPLPVTVVAGLAAPVLLMHGTADQTVPVEQSRVYERAARALGKPVEAVYFEGIDHVTSLQPGSQVAAQERAIAFLRATLLGATAPAQLPRTGEPAPLPAAAAAGVGLLRVGLVLRPSRRLI